MLDELKVDRSKVFVILSKSDRTQPERIDDIANALGISNPIVYRLRQDMEFTNSKQ
ncbi:MAG: hypothetical protein WA364_28225 [Candidatus Nitrosopolaris sp.]